MVGHSIGGLMIKEVFHRLCCSFWNFSNLFRTDFHDEAALQENKEEHKVAKRIRALFFLATPHQDASAPELQRRIILACTRPQNLQETTGSSRYMGQMQMTNNDFANIADLKSEMLLWSFYEGIKTELDDTTAFVLEKASAVIGILILSPVPKHQLRRPRSPKREIP